VFFLVISISDGYCDKVLNIVLCNIQVYYKLDLLEILSLKLSLTYITLTYNNLLRKFFIHCAILVMKLTLKISNLAISRTPVKCCLNCFVSSVSLYFLTNNLNRRSNMPLDMAPKEYETYNCIKYITFNFLNNSSLCGVSY
jgi:hypothetical protein